MAGNPRIEELRRRVEKDPASIAFAQLAEEHRRAGEYEEAIRVCRSGLAQHPGYLSARVTLGRALIEIAQYDDAQAELEQVLRAAPDNLAAIRALADIHQRRDEHAVPGIEAVEPVDPLAGIPDEFTLPPLPSFQPLTTVEDDPSPEDPALPQLEAWLAAILADRQRRAAQ